MPDAVLLSEQTEPSPDSDLWGLLCLLWKLLLGVTPFAGPSLLKTGVNVSKRRIANPLPEDCCPETRAFLEALLAANPRPTAAGLRAHPFLQSYVPKREQIARLLAQLSKEQLATVFADFSLQADGDQVQMLTEQLLLL